MPSEEGGGVRACPTGLRRPGDTDGLIRLLAADVVAYADGGGKTQTFLRPMYGRGRIARLLLRFRTVMLPVVSAWVRTGLVPAGRVARIVTGHPRR
jgi:hypothetical protein